MGELEFLKIALISIIFVNFIAVKTDPMKKILILFLFCVLASFKTADIAEDTASINKTLDKWHDAAAKADFDSYFGFLTEDAIFIGTDATENWDKKAFMEFAKPYFEKGKVWNFKSLERHILYTF